MEMFQKLFGSSTLFIYHCFDRLVIHGYLSGLSRPEQVAYFFHTVRGVEAISKEVLCERTHDYQQWVEAYIRNHRLQAEWAEKGRRKEDQVSRWLCAMKRRKAYGVYFVYRSMEQGPSFRSSVPKYPTADPNFRILTRQRLRFTHYYFYIRDQELGPFVMRVASFLPFPVTYYINRHSFIEKELQRAGIGYRKNDNAFLACADPADLQAAADRLTPSLIRQRLEYWTYLLGPKFSTRERGAINLHRFYAIRQVEYCRNFIFRRHFPIHKIFERSCEIGLWRLTADKISEVFGQRLTKALKGKLHTTLEKIEHGHHVFRAYFKNAFVKQYEKFRCFLRVEACSNNLADFHLKKGLDHLAAVRDTLLSVVDRFADFQARSLNVHVDFPLFQRIALPIVLGKVRFPGIKIHDTRILRLMEVLLHAKSQVGSWTAAELHAAVLQTYELFPASYRLSQLRYDLRKMKAHGLLQRDGRHYAYRLTPKGQQVSLLFVIFHKRVCGPLANSLFHHRPPDQDYHNSKLEAAYHQADRSIQKIIDLLQAA